MGLNLSRGEPLKYYSSDRITQIIGNGLVTLIDEKTEYNRFFNNNEMVFYKNINDLSEKIIKISKDEKLRKKIGKNGKIKYQKYFNSTIVANYIIEKTFDLKNKLRLKNISSAIYSCHTLKPFDANAVIKASIETGGIVSVEENTIDGGLGSIISEILLDNNIMPKNFLRLGLKSGFSSIVGSQKYLRRCYNIDSASIISKILEMLK